MTPETVPSPANDRLAKRITLAEIVKKVEAVHHLGPGELMARMRAKRCSHARQQAFWLARKLTRLSLPQIGAYFDHRHHTTILFGVRQIDKRLAAADHDTALMIVTVQRELTQ